MLEALQLLGVPLRLPNNLGEENWLEKLYVVQHGKHRKARVVIATNHEEVPGILPQPTHELVYTSGLLVIFGKPNIVRLKAGGGDAGPGP